MAAYAQYETIAKSPVDFSLVKIQLAAALLLIVALSVKIWIRAEATHVGYELASARKEAVDLDMNRRELELNRSVLLRPDSLRQEASKRLGLMKFNPEQAAKIIYVN